MPTIIANVEKIKRNLAKERLIRAWWTAQLKLNNVSPLDVETFNARKAAFDQLVALGYDFDENNMPRDGAEDIVSVCGNPIGK